MIDMPRYHSIVVRLTNVHPITDMRRQLECSEEKPIIDWTPMYQAGVSGFGDCSLSRIRYAFSRLIICPPVIGIDFIYRLLQILPKDRISLTGAGKHIWFVVPESLTPFITNASVGAESFSLSYLLPDSTD